MRLTFNYFMFCRFLFCPAVWGMALCSSSFAGEIPEEPVITVSPYNWSTQSVRMGDPSKKRQLDLELKVTMKAAEYKVALKLANGDELPTVGGFSPSI